MRCAVVAALALIGFSAAAHAKTKTPLAESETIDINSATEAQLMRLPGVGLKRARAVVERRKEHAFGSPDELVHVRGFGRSLTRRLRAHLTARPSPVRSAVVLPTKREPQ